LWHLQFPREAGFIQRLIMRLREERAKFIAPMGIRPRRTRGRSRVGSDGGIFPRVLENRACARDGRRVAALGRIPAGILRRAILLLRRPARAFRGLGLLLGGMVRTFCRARLLLVRTALTVL
jgi:hypothetical protein